MDITYLSKKLMFSILESYKLFHRKNSPKLIMTLLVKNEEVMLEKNLIFHKKMGVDGFIVTDNNSTDKTPDIIKKYQEKGWILEAIEEKATDYEQKKWVDRMIWIAKRKYHADWIINADSDELWYSDTLNLKEELAHTRVNSLNCQVTNVYPDKDKDWWQWDTVVKGFKDCTEYDLSPYSIFKPLYKKVMHKATGYIQISMGNHKVAMFPKLTKKSDIRIYHYNILSKEQFLQKMINGGIQLEQHKGGKHVGRHWKYFYNLHKEGKLEAEYERVIGSSYYEVFKKKQIIVQDTSIVDVFKNMNNI